MKTLIVFALTILFSGCESSSDKETVGKEIADDYNEAMDKAREVEDKLMEHKDNIDEAMNEAMRNAEEEIEGKNP